MRKFTVIKEEIEFCETEAKRLQTEAENENDLRRADYLIDAANDLITRAKALRWAMGAKDERD